MVKRRSIPDSRGITLVEVVVALGLLSGAIVTLAQLSGLAVRANLSARVATLAAVLAAQKMEQLRALPGVEQQPPGGSVQTDIAGFFEHFDGVGRPMPAGSSAPMPAVFVRRWSIERLPSEPARSRVLRVRVIPVSPYATEPGWPRRQADESRILTVITARDR